MVEIEFPAWSSKLANLYFKKRYCRMHDDNGRRKAWRHIAAEKQRILETGVAYIELHLICRVLTNPRNENARKRLISYQNENPDCWGLRPKASSPR